jgi:hypothetical protein
MNFEPTELFYYISRQRSFLSAGPYNLSRFGCIHVRIRLPDGWIGVSVFDIDAQKGCYALPEIIKKDLSLASVRRPDRVTINR